MNCFFTYFQHGINLWKKRPCLWDRNESRGHVWLLPGKQWKLLPETLTLNNFNSQIREGMENRSNTEEMQKEEIFKNGLYKQHSNKSGKKKKQPKSYNRKKGMAEKNPKVLRNPNHDKNDPLENPKGCFLLFIHLQFFVFHFFHYWYA